MPYLVSSEARVEALADPTAVLEMVPRNCKLDGKYKKLSNIPSFEIKAEMIAFASPDSTYAVTKKLFDNAKKEIIIGIYDYSAVYMKELALHAMQRGVKMKLMLDIDSKEEQKLFDELVKMGCDGVEAPSCASKFVHYFQSSHEKVIVIDGIWCIVQSGNYSNNSIPLNEKDGGDKNHFIKGNRDMGVAIRSTELSKFFIKLLKADMKLEEKAESAERLSTGQARPVMPELVEAVPKQLPSVLFPSKSFKPLRKIKVTPILTPDNYMEEIVHLLASAKKSILIENQYIRGSQAEISKLLKAIQSAVTKNKKLDIRIILGKLFGTEDYNKEVINIAFIKKNFGLKTGTHIRYIDTKRFVHCHNKLIIVDNTRVLVSSQNWSNTGVSSNREAGLLLNFPEMAAYFTKIFESDWSTANQQIPKPGKSMISPESLRSGRFVKVVAADYQEV